jgi:arylformamidase
MIPNLPLEELARRYNNGAAVPDWEATLLPRWQREGARVCAESGGVRNVPYGALPRNKLDVFTPPGAPPTNGWPAMVFIHGGYWQMRCKDDWSVIAAPFVPADHDSRHRGRNRGGGEPRVEGRRRTQFEP